MYPVGIWALVPSVYVSCFSFTILYVSPTCTMSSLHFLRLRSFPSTLPYCTSLTILRSRTCLPLRRIRSLVYIFRVLVLYYLRTNITYFSLVSVWGSLERSDPPARLQLSPVSSVLVLILPAHVLVWIHWGQRAIYPVGTLWVNYGFWNNSPSSYPVGKWWALFWKWPICTCWVFHWVN